MILPLNDHSWEVKGFWPYEPLWMTFKPGWISTLESGGRPRGVTPWIPATVPGDITNDLVAAGVIDDPRYEGNSVTCEWVANRWWMYRTAFPTPSASLNRRTRLVLQGVDYRCHVFLNGEKLGFHEGMFTPFTDDISDTMTTDGSENRLCILIEAAPQEMMEIGYTSWTSTQKSRFNYKWDFGTRLVSMGIWEDVLLDITGPAAFTTACVNGTPGNGSGTVTAHFGASDMPAGTVLRTSLSFQGTLIEEQEHAIGAEQSGPVSSVLKVDRPHLWWPNGYGEQPLYDLAARLICNGQESDIRRFRVGIRSLQYRTNPGSPPDALPYTPVINERPVYIRGVNLTPDDLLPGIVTRERYEELLRLVANMNVNLVRVWGGGIIEKKAFYELCDELGLLVWQEFIQSSSGIDNIPSQKPRFLELLRATAETAVCDRRNHVCLTVWSGGNELCSEPDRPATCEDANLAMLQSIVKQHDPARLFLPTSASGPREFLNTDPDALGTNHDVHGSWTFLGPEKHYRHYRHGDALLHSEVGVAGVSSVKSLKRFLGPGNLKPFSMEQNLVWRHHGDWWDTLEYCQDLFGELTTLETFVLASQYIQAEGLRFICEANRRRQPRNSGTIVWQFNEPWPNTSCTNLVDYYREQKPAYYAVKRSFAPFLVSLDYGQIVWKPNDVFRGSVHLHSDGPGDAVVTARLLDSNGQTFEEFREETALLPDRSVRAVDLAQPLPGTGDGLVWVRLEAETGTLRSINTYCFSTLPRTPFRSILGNNPCLDAVVLDQTPDCISYSVTNEGTRIAPFVRMESDADPVYHDDAWFALLPGETRKMTVHPLGDAIEKDRLSVHGAGL